MPPEQTSAAKKNPAIRTTITIVLSLLLWLLIYRAVHLIVYGVHEATIQTLMSSVGSILKVLLSRPVNAPTQDGRWLDILFLAGSFGAAVYVAMRATKESKALERDASSSPQPAERSDAVSTKVAS